MDETANDPQTAPSAAVSAPNTSRPNAGVTIQRPIIVAGLFLINIMLTFSVFVGVILAYIWRSEAQTEEWEKTHYTYLIQTFWIGLVLTIGGVFLWFGAFIFALPPSGAGNQTPPDPAFFIVVFGMFFVWLALAIWFCTRCILSLIKAGKREPMPKPRTWLF